MRISTITLLVTVGLTLACASSGPAHAASTTATPGADSRGGLAVGETLTADQLLRSAASNLYDALQQLDPAVLTGHGRAAPDVYVGGVMQLSGVDRLKELPLTVVRDVTYLRAEQVQGQYLADSRSLGGAILVRLR